MREELARQRFKTGDDRIEIQLARPFAHAREHGAMAQMDAIERTDANDTASRGDRIARDIAEQHTHRTIIAKNAALPRLLLLYARHSRVLLAGIQRLCPFRRNEQRHWIPAFAGMTS